VQIATAARAHLALGSITAGGRVSRAATDVLTKLVNRWPCVEDRRAYALGLRKAGLSRPQGGAAAPLTL
jgi:hypothetical protein